MWSQFVDCFSAYACNGGLLVEFCTEGPLFHPPVLEVASHIKAARL